MNTAAESNDKQNCLHNTLLFWLKCGSYNFRHDSHKTIIRLK